MARNHILFACRLIMRNIKEAGDDTSYCFVSSCQDVLRLKNIFVYII